MEGKRWKTYLESSTLGMLESGEDELDLSGGEVRIASVGGGVGGVVLRRHGGYCGWR